MAGRQPAGRQLRKHTAVAAAARQSIDADAVAGPHKAIHVRAKLSQTTAAVIMSDIALN